jgi:DNA ligase-associated metallophosphoesterase
VECMGVSAGAAVRVTGSLTVEVAGEAMVLLPHRAAYWPARRTLLIADVHLDKCEGMREMGMPVPRAIFDEQVSRLDAALRVTGAARLLVLGDLLHGTVGLTPAMVERFASWRAGCPVEFGLVPGNHDRGLELVRSAWGVEVLPACYDEGPFRFQHLPEAAAGRYVWGGHLHPAVTLRSASDSLKLACFCIGTSVAVLPAFSTFTAGGPVGRRRGERVFGVVPGERVVEV